MTPSGVRLHRGLTAGGPNSWFADPALSRIRSLCDADGSGVVAFLERGPMGCSVGRGWIADDGQMEDESLSLPVSFDPGSRSFLTRPSS